MTAMWTKGAVALFSICVLSLLVQNRANEPQLEVTTLESYGEIFGDFERGGTILTGEESWLQLQIGEAIISVGGNTHIRFERLFEDDVRLFVSQGRVAVSESAVTITTDRVSATGENFELVNYDFQEQVTVEPSSGIVEVSINHQALQAVDAAQGEFLEISELPPFTAVHGRSETLE